MQTLEKLGNKEHDKNKSYNFLILKEFVLMVQRQFDKVQLEGIEFGFNSLAYSGTLAVKTEE